MSQRLAAFQNFVSERMRIDDARELHVVRLPDAVTCGFEFERREMKLFEERPLDKGDILDIFERHRLLDLEDDALAEPQCAFGDVALQFVEVVPRPPLADAAEPHDRERQADDRAHHRESDRDHKVGAIQRVELRDMRSCGRNGGSCCRYG